MNRRPLLRQNHCFLVVACLAVLAGSCGKRNVDPTVINNGTKIGLLTAREAALLNYRFGFSAQVVDTAGNPVTHFAVSPLSYTNDTFSVLNALGESNGIFHFSQTGSPVELTFLISIPDHQPFLKTVRVPGDCLESICAQKPLEKISARTRKSTLVEGGNASTLGLESVIAQTSTHELFRELVRSGKLDDTLASYLSSSQNGAVVSEVLILLNGGNGIRAPQVASDLLSNVKPDRVRALLGGGLHSLGPLVSLLSGSGIETTRALFSLGALLRYLPDPTVSAKGGPVGQVMGTLMEAEGGMASSLKLIAKDLGRSAQAPQWAAAGIANLLEQTKTSTMRTESGAEWLSRSILAKGAAIEVGQRLSFREGQDNVLHRYASLLIQGFTGPRASELIPSFNELISERGILGLKHFAKEDALRKKYAPLSPYLEPISRGLNSKDARRLAEALAPFLEKRNPGRALALYLFQYEEKNGVGLGNLTSLYPSLSQWAKEIAPDKQVFAAQMLQGLVNGDLQNVTVERDLTESPAVILKGNARDLFKIALLANVERMIKLNPK